MPARSGTHRSTTPPPPPRGPGYAPHLSRRGTCDVHSPRTAALDATLVLGALFPALLTSCSTEEAAPADAVDPFDAVGDTGNPAPVVAATRRFPRTAAPGVEYPGCPLASPLLYDGGAQPRIIVSPGNGRLAALDPEPGAVAWQLLLPTPDGEDPFVVATPIRVEGRLVVAYHTVTTPDGVAPGDTGHDVNEFREVDKAAETRRAVGGGRMFGR